VPNAGVKGLRAQAGLLAHEFYGRPSASMWVCGVTGTNGKTSCTHWLAALLSGRDGKAAVVGTLGNGFLPDLKSTGNTTPDVLELHAMLAAYRSAGATAVAMEVSSHGLDQGRVNGVAFDCALFTNLTHDHLDYHGWTTPSGRSSRGDSRRAACERSAIPCLANPPPNSFPFRALKAKGYKSNQAGEARKRPFPR